MTIYSGLTPSVPRVMSRGDRREEIVQGDADRELWVKTLGEACTKCEWQVHAYCLMKSHFHLVVETPLGNLVSGMKWLLGTYTVRFNARHRLRGHLFAGRYKSVVVDDSDDSDLRIACDYVHLNPARARLLTLQESLEDYPWSSYPAYLRPARGRAAWLRTDRLLGEHGVGRDDRGARVEFSRRMEAERQEVNRPGASDAPMRHGWRLGGEAFLARLVDRMEGRLSENHHARERIETTEVKAERIIARMLEEMGWSEAELRERGKCRSEKVRIALRLRAETTLTLKRVADRLAMGTWTNLSKLLYEARSNEHYPS